MLIHDHLIALYPHHGSADRSLRTAVLQCINIYTYCLYMDLSLKMYCFSSDLVYVGCLEIYQSSTANVIARAVRSILRLLAKMFVCGEVCYVPI